MNLTNEQKEAMRDAVKQCCLNADCKTIAKIFETAKWTWCDFAGDYIPTEREIRRSLYGLGKDALEALVKDCEDDTFDTDNPNPYTSSSGRLFFTIDFNTLEGKVVSIVEDACFSVGIRTEFATAEIANDNDYYKIEIL